MLDPDTGWLMQVVFQLDKWHLVVGINPEADELKTAVLTSPHLEQADRSLRKERIANQRKKILNIWRLTNSSGYEEGLQIELEGVARTNIQLLAEAGRIDLTVFNREVQ